MAYLRSTGGPVARRMWPLPDSTTSPAFVTSLAGPDHGSLPLELIGRRAIELALDDDRDGTERGCPSTAFRCYGRAPQLLVRAAERPRLRPASGRGQIASSARRFPATASEPSDRRPPRCRTDAASDCPGLEGQPADPTPTRSRVPGSRLPGRTRVHPRRARRGGGDHDRRRSAAAGSGAELGRPGDPRRNRAVDGVLAADLGGEHRHIATCGEAPEESAVAAAGASLASGRADHRAGFRGQAGVEAEVPTARVTGGPGDPPLLAQLDGPPRPIHSSRWVRSPAWTTGGSPRTTPWSPRSR